MPSILLIEDDELFREALATSLSKRGYTVMQARDGEEGLRIFRVEPADLVLTDIVMPNKEGLALVEELRRDYPKLGIIAMSGGLAHNAPLYLKLAGALGANRTLQKPFDLPTLLKAIEEVLAATGQEKSARP
jgi:DNA-binding response OmpR family regulator